MNTPQEPEVKMFTRSKMICPELNTSLIDLWVTIFKHSKRCSDFDALTESERVLYKIITQRLITEISIMGVTETICAEEK